MSTEADELERASEVHRARIAVLVDELRGHVTPGEIVNQLVGRDAGQELVRYLTWQAGRQFRKNPVPIAVIGTGIAWLLLANALRNQRQIPLHDGLDYEDYVALQAAESDGIFGSARRVIRQLSNVAAHHRESETYAYEEASMAHSEKHPGSPRNRPSYNDSDGGRSGAEVQPGESALQDESGEEQRGLIGRTLHRGREAAANLGQSAVNKAKNAATELTHAALQKSGEALGDAKDAVGQTASSLMERTNEMARRTGRAAGHTASRAGSGMGRLAREQPLLVAGVGFVLGVALGALFPLSRMENEMLGEQADRLKESAKELATEGYEKVKTVAQRTYEAATETLKSQTEGQTGFDSTGSGSESGASTPSSGTTYGSDDGGDTTGVYRH
jgi:ElaB/YqjD/DUF883 family membrane-anchored ribosome-binding protein